MKHIRSSSNNIFLLETSGNPNERTSPFLTDFGEAVTKGSICIDYINGIAYISKGNIWEPIGNVQEALKIAGIDTSDLQMDDFTGTGYGVIINSPNSIIKQGTDKSVVLGGEDIIAKTSDTAYVENLGIFSKGTDGTSAFEGILTSVDLNEDVDWKLPNKSGVIALLTDIQNNGEESTGGYLIATSDKGLVALSTNGDGSLATNTPVASDPVSGSYVTVFLNGQELEVGDAVKTKAFYFSDDGGTTPKSFDHNHPNGKVNIGDELYFNPSVAGFELQDGWRLTLLYLKYSEQAISIGGISIDGDTYIGQYKVVSAKAIDDFTNNKEFITKEYNDYHQNILLKESIAGSDGFLFNLNAKYKISDIITETTSGSLPMDISIGSTSGGVDIINNVSLTESFEDLDLLKGFFDKDNNTDVFISSPSWSAQLKVYIRLKRIMH